MCASLIYMIPVASILSQEKLTADTELRGDLQDELEKLVASYTPIGSIQFVRNDNIDASINTVYKKGTNLLIIFTQVMGALNLSMDVGLSPERGFRVMLIIRTYNGGIQNASLDFGS